MRCINYTRYKWVSTQFLYIFDRNKFSVSEWMQIILDEDSWEQILPAVNTNVVDNRFINQVYSPRIFDMLELCISGQAFRIFLRSSLAHTMNAFIGRLICGLFSPSLFCCLTILAEEREGALGVTSSRFILVRNESDFETAAWRSQNKSVISA